VIVSRAALLARLAIAYFAFVFFIGFLPTWLILRARIWSQRRRIEAMERNRLASLPPEPALAEDVEPVI